MVLRRLQRIIFGSIFLHRVVMELHTQPYRLWSREFLISFRLPEQILMGFRNYAYDAKKPCPGVDTFEPQELLFTGENNRFICMVGFIGSVDSKFHSQYPDPDLDPVAAIPQNEMSTTGEPNILADQFWTDGNEFDPTLLSS